MATSQKISKKIMGNRGSKSLVCKNTIVKEQRVNGSWLEEHISRLRCTLKGFERNYQVKILSNQINKLRSYTTIATQQLQFKLDPNFVTGFVDAEGSFIVDIIRDPQSKTG
jgi:hypothetical protein